MIWVRDVNTSILKYVKTLMEDVTDHNGHVINVKTLMSSPNGELQVESYPSVTIALDKVRDKIEFNDHNSYVVEQVSDSQMSKKLKAGKYSFDYFINFWSKSPIELDAMTKRWIMNTPKHQLIDIKDVDTDTIYECKLTQDGGLSLNEGATSTITGQSIFRHVFMCHVIVGIDNNPSELYAMVKEIHSKKEEV